MASETQSNDWTEEDRNRFYGLLSKCDKETYLSHRDHKEFHLDRNRYILGNSQLLIAIHDSKFGKTMYSVNRAKEKHVDLVVINPNTFQISKKYSSKRI